MCVHVYMHGEDRHGVAVRMTLRNWLCLLPLWAPGTELPLPWLCSRFFCLLSFLTGPEFKILIFF